MLTLNLENDKACCKRGCLGPIDGMRIVGRSIQALPHKFEVLRLVGEQWHDAGEAYNTVVIDARVLIYGQLRCGGRGTLYGPFDGLRLSGTEMQIWANVLNTFARINMPENAWIIEQDQASWRTLVVFPAYQLAEQPRAKAI